MPAPRISTVVAAAGAGKTTRIVQSIAEAVMTRAPEDIVATTFTVKAANELIERARAHLVEAGRSEIATRLLGARFGTVNAICGQMAAEYALDLGRSPSTEVIPEEQVARMFAIAAADAIARHAPLLHRLGTAFGFDEPVAMGESPDWRNTVRRLIELARANGIGSDGLARSAQRSVETFLALLPPAQAAGSVAVLDGELNQAVAAAVAAIPEPCSATATKSVDLLRQALAAFGRGDHLSWPDWARLSKVDCAKKDGRPFAQALDDVKRAAEQHTYHPRLRRDCEMFIRTLFRCAAEALEAYQAYKAERGLLDFVDQETLALQVLQTPGLAARLGEHIGRVFVDEFQDSSPLQIAIFAALAEIAEASTWVGDPKQAIYGFRNADTMLTQAAFHGVMAESTESPAVLSKSYRSRQGIVEFVNAAFGPALAAMGLPSAQHAFTGTSRLDDAFTQPPCAVWWLDGNKQMRAAALAGGVHDLLATGEAWVVEDRAGAARPARPGDIAVLCRSNSEVAGIAAALSRLGTMVAVAREGLIATPHVQMIMAAVRWTVDPSDRLALAELARFFAEDAASDLWLQAVSAVEPDEALRAAVPISCDLMELRGQLLKLTPAELVDAVIALPRVMALIARWGDPAMRLDDLEALRGCVRIYETECAGSGTPATPSGFVVALAATEPKRPKSLRPDAVTVLTYHGAKGLEWPIVILTGLDSAPRPRLFDQPVAEVEGSLDWHDPLAGRWIRYWPWPYASQQKEVCLDRTALDAALGQAAACRACEEEARLLYVGVTRARDYVVFAPACTKPDPQWLQVLDGPEQPRQLVLPQGAEMRNPGWQPDLSRTRQPAGRRRHGVAPPGQARVRADRAHGDNAPPPASPAQRRTRPGSVLGGRTFQAGTTTANRR